MIAWLKEWASDCAVLLFAIAVFWACVATEHDNLAALLGVAIVFCVIDHLADVPQDPDGVA